MSKKRDFAETAEIHKFATRTGVRMVRRRNKLNGETVGKFICFHFDKVIVYKMLQEDIRFFTVFRFFFNVPSRN